MATRLRRADEAFSILGISMYTIRNKRRAGYVLIANGPCSYYKPVANMSFLATSSGVVHLPVYDRANDPLGNCLNQDSIQ